MANVLDLEKSPKTGFFTTKNVVALTTLTILSVAVIVGGGMLKDWTNKKIAEVKASKTPTA